MQEYKDVKLSGVKDLDSPLSSPRCFKSEDENKGRKEWQQKTK